MLQIIIRKRKKKLRHWPPAAADACLGRCDCMREGRAAVSQWCQGGSFESLPGSLLATTHSAVRTPVMGKS